MNLRVFLILLRWSKIQNGRILPIKKSKKERKMKKITYTKITLLFLVLLCILSALTINLKNAYYESKENELLDKVLENLEKVEENKEEEEKITFRDGSIGMIVIPSIKVKAPIYEGTSEEVLKYTVRTFWKYKFMGAEM